ncbi:MAG: fasciclin domain-containing protein [Stackebrandtia sp.]
MSINLLRRTAALATAGALALALTACGAEDDADESSGAAEDSQDNADGGEAEGDDSAAQTFGDGCAAVPEDGDGSFQGMAQDPVATAASNNPVLSTLVAAVTEAELGDTLNSSEDITVFAPTDDAFGKIPKEDLDAVLADKETLTEILTYHVVGQTVTPDQLGSAGPFTTLQGGEIEVSGSGEQFTVNDEASVVCGNVRTSNATVYIIDTVLMP